MIRSPFCSLAIVGLIWLSGCARDTINEKRQPRAASRATASRAPIGAPRSSAASRAKEAKRVRRVVVELLAAALSPKRDPKAIEAKLAAARQLATKRERPLIERLTRLLSRPLRPGNERERHALTRDYVDVLEQWARLRAKDLSVQVYVAATLARLAGALGTRGPPDLDLRAKARAALARCLALSPNHRGCRQLAARIEKTRSPSSEPTRGNE